MLTFNNTSKKVAVKPVILLTETVHLQAVPSPLYWLCLLCGVLLFSPLLAGQSGNKVIWQIGKLDQSPFEFARGAADNVTFQVGQSNAAKDWPGHQDTGHTYKVLFPIEAPSGHYLLKVVALIDQPRVPAFRVDVNGHSGTFYLHPSLSYSRSDFTFAFDPHEAQSAVTVDIPASYLKAGENSIALTCIDEPATATGQEEIGGISYDVLSLEQAGGSPRREEATVRMESTIFFHSSGAALSEVIDGFLSFPNSWQAGVADLEVNGKHYAANYPAGDFGQQKISFDVAEWVGTVRGKVRVSSDSKHATEVSLAAQRKWTIYVVPHTHLDVGYTDYQGKVAETQARVLTQADNLIQEHPDFRFSMDGSWNLQQLLETRPKEKRDEILNLIRTGKMAMPAQYCNLLTGYASLETLYRSLYDSKELAQQYKLPFEYANITDVPTYTGAYPSILASSGVKYWIAAANNDRAPIFAYDQWNEKSPFWWQGPDGKKVLFWYSRHYEQVQSLFGLIPQLNAVRESLPIYLQAYAKPTYKPNVALLYGTQVENTDLVPATATFADEWNKQYAFPKLTYATFPDFFHYVEANYRNDLPTFKGDGGGYWEDGIGSDAYYAAEDRQNQSRALSAEVLSSVTHSVDPNLNPPAGLFTDIWRNIILFAEHTWFSYNSVSEPDHDETVRQMRVKDDRADRASVELEDVVNRSLSQLADQIHIPANTLVVFNSLNWRRDGLIETDLFENPKLFDLTTQQDVPLEILYHKQRFLHVRFLAKDLPAVGYKCFRITYSKPGFKQASSSDDDQPSEASSKSTTVENAFYKLTIDEGSGALAAIYDKQLHRDIVDAASPYKFGQYLYVTGGDGDTQMINPFPALAPGELTIHPAVQGKVVGVEQTPWGQSIRLASSTTNTPEIQTEILLFNDEKKLEFHYRVHKTYTNAKEAVYFAFPVAAQNPQFHFANQQGWVDPARDLMKGGSLEWFNVQQWMAVGNQDLSVGIVPLDASLASFGDINRGKWPGEFHPKTSTLFSYAMNNYWHTNYRAGQGGDFSFRYTVTSGSQFDGSALSQLGLREMRPVEVNYVVSQDKVGDPPRPLPATGQGFLEMTNPEIGLVTWKRASNEQGSVLRLQELAGRSNQTTIQFPHSQIDRAELCSGVEDDLGPVPVTDNALTVALKPFEVVTVRVVPK